MWAYRDPQNSIVGFGALTVCTDCFWDTDNQLHTYIPLLAVHPDMRGVGHGRSIVEHLVTTAAEIVAAEDDLHNALFLDVYEDSIGAFRLYKKCGFIVLGDARVDDTNGKKYYVMAKRVSTAK